jgi:hypothetical protein
LVTAPEHEIEEGIAKEPNGVRVFLGLWEDADSN